MRKQSKAAKIAYSAVLGAVSLMLVYFASIAPVGSWGIVAVAGLFPAAVVIAAGLRSGFLCWAGVSVLAFLLIPGRLCTLLYAALFGVYPMVKSLVEGLRRRALEYVLKLIFFNAVFTLVFLLMRTQLLGSLPEQLGKLWLLYPVGNVVFLAYDFGFSKAIGLYIARIGRAVK